MRLILGYYKHLLTLPQRVFLIPCGWVKLFRGLMMLFKIRAFINDTAISLLVNVFIVLFSFGLMFLYSWKMALIILTVVPLYSALYYITNRLNRKRGTKADGKCC